MLAFVGRPRVRDGLLVLLVTSSVLLLYGVAGAHPHLTRQQAIDNAVSQQQQRTARVAAKLVRESDLERAAPEFWKVTGPDLFVWVVAISGDYGIRGEFPSGPTSWGIAVVRDQLGPAQLWATWGGVQGDWPPFFDGLTDLS